MDPFGGIPQCPCQFRAKAVSGAAASTRFAGILKIVRRQSNLSVQMLNDDATTPLQKVLMPTERRWAYLPMHESRDRITDDRGDSTPFDPAGARGRGDDQKAGCGIGHPTFFCAHEDDSGRGAPHRHDERRDVGRDREARSRHRAGVRCRSGRCEA
jgi:hypothetical protein